MSTGSRRRVQTRANRNVWRACAGIAIAAVGGVTFADDTRAQARFEFDPNSAFGSSAEPSASISPNPLGRAQIAWRVENPFRFFTDPKETARHREIFERLPAEARRDPILAAERTLSRRFATGWAANIKGRTCWNARRNLHVCPEGDDYVNPKSHRVIAEITGLADVAAVRCTWTVRGRTAKGSVSRTERAPCDQPVALAIPYPSGARVSVAIGRAVAAETDIRVEDLLIVGVGDSFGSGEGNPDVPVRFDRKRSANYGVIRKKVALAGYPARAGTWRQIGDRQFLRGNARWLDQACHRSLYSHQLRAALQLAIETPHRAVTFLHLACSGAEITRGLFLRYKGHEWVPDPPEFSQISAIARAQCGPRKTRVQILPEAYHMRGQVPDLEGNLTLHECDRRRSRKIDLMLVSIGGNDMGFAKLVANAVLRDGSALRRLGGWFGQVFGSREATQKLDELEQRYKALNRALHYILHIPWSESDRVILTAYPPMGLLSDGRTACPSSNAGMEVLPAFYMTRKLVADAERAARRLNRVMTKATRKHGWSFAEQHRRQFAGHSVCAGYDGVALSSADDLRFPLKVDGRWVPYNPADYRPYASRQRWFRTPNDAYLTGHFHVSSSALQRALQSRSLMWTQVLLASTYSGSFHPTAEGHAAIADSVVRVARRVLEKYEGGNRIK